MRELIPKDEYGIFADTKDTARVDSLFVASFLKNNTNGDNSYPYNFDKFQMLFGIDVTEEDEDE